MRAVLTRRAISLPSAPLSTPSVLEALAIERTPDNEAQLPSVVRVEHITSLLDLYETLDKRPGLRGRYIVLPNVTDGGLGTLMRSGLQAKYKEMPSVGGYLDGTVELKAKQGSGNRKKFDGLDPAWGNKRIALFQTSDSRSDTFADLGKHTTWVKWSRASAEAIRQACLAQESRISQTKPATPSVYVAHLTVSNSRFLGPVELDLNAQYNALIGGRGTGKSTMLDYVRWCLCDRPAASQPEDEVPSAARQRTLVSSTLTPFKAHVEVEVIINGLAHRVRRYSETGEVHLKVGDGPFEKTTDASIQSLLPIHAYSQKQLSSVAVRFDELMRFITAPIARELESLDSSIEEVSDRLRQNYAAVQRQRSLARSVQRLIVTDKSLTDQATNMRSEISGLSSEDQRTLDGKPALDRTHELVAGWNRDVQTGVASATGMLSVLEGILNSLEEESVLQLPHRDQLTALRTATENSLRHLREAIDDAVRDLETGDSVSQVGRVALNERLVAILDQEDAHYEQVKERSSVHAAKLEDLSGVENQRKLVNATLRQQKAELAALGDTVSAHHRLREELRANRSARSDALQKQCEAVSTASNELLKADIDRSGGITALENRFRSAVGGGGVRSVRIENMYLQLAADVDPLDSWEHILQELEGLMLMDEGENLSTEKAPVMSRLGMPLNDQQRIRTRLTPDAWLDLTLAPIPDVPVFKYQTKPGEFIKFSEASAGQQATALLRVLLAQSGMPLIIDQPEEDLDSQVIEDIVGWLWKAKESRQLLFASHNANLVVNGDAELVVVCDYRQAGDQSGGKISAQGAIDTPDIRSEVTRIMEGGEKAFRLRKEKYGF